MNNNFHKTTLKNGIKLYLYKDKNMKKVFVSYGIKYGSSGEYFDFYLDNIHYHVPPGCAHFLEHILLEHSKYGNLYKIFAQRNYIKNGLTSMNFTNFFFIGKKDILKSIKELINAVDDPIFTEEDIKKSSKAICEETKIGYDNMFRMSLSIAHRNLYKNMELVHETLTAIGDENTTKTINYDTLMACHNAFYNNENKILLVAGNINEKEIINHLEKIYSEIPNHPNKRKKYRYDLKSIRKKEQIKSMNLNTEYCLFAFRNKITKKFNTKEIKYYMSFLLNNKFNNYSTFVENQKKKEIISKIELLDFMIIEEEFITYIGAYCQNYKNFIKELKKELTKNNFREEEFNLFIKSTIATEAKRLDYKYSIFRNFVFRLNYSDDFDDINFLKTLTYERFIEFFNSLDITKNTVAVIK